MLESSSRSKVNILLVEDDPDDVEFVRHAFARVWADCVLHAVEDGEKAIAFLNRTGEFSAMPVPDLILLDLNMPRMNGYEVLKVIKADERLKAIPVVVLSTSSDQASIREAYQLHANSFITKPVSADQLERVVELVIEYWFSAVGLVNED